MHGYPQLITPIDHVEPVPRRIRAVLGDRLVLDTYVHPRNRYARADAVRSTGHVRIELAGVVLAETSSPVMVFETGQPPRHYIDRTEVALERLTASGTVSSCPCEGTAS